VTVHIFLSKVGRVDDKEVKLVVGLMEECYGRLEPHEVELVDLCVFEKFSSVDAFLAREYREVGVRSARFNGSFFAMHDAWRGTSRIIFCVERAMTLPKLVKEGGIRHEVGHSVLHGELSYYLLPIPPALLRLAERLHLTREYAANLLYLVSIAVKDYEVSRLLTDKGYLEDQLAYARHYLTVSESDTLSWRISRGNPLAESLFLVSCLKPLSCATPFILDERYCEEMKRSLSESLYYLPKKHSNMLLELVTEHFPSLGKDTLDNINHIADLMVQRIIEPIFLSTHKT